MAQLTKIAIVLADDGTGSGVTLSADVQVSIATGIFRHTVTDVDLPFSDDQQAAITALMAGIRAAITEAVRAALVLP